MILPLNAIWGGFTPPFLGTTAQVFDGSFDYDIISNWDDVDFTGAFSILIDYEKKVETTDYTFTQGSLSESRFLGLSQQLGDCWLRLRSVPGNTGIVLRFPIPIGRNRICITKSAGLLANTVTAYLNGVNVSYTVLTNTLASYIPSTVTNAYIWGSNLGQSRILGNVANIEILNFKATDTQAVNATSSSTAIASFTRAGIPYNTSNYRLAVNFDKINGENPTSRDNTPVYTITGIGGTTYGTYLP